MVRSRKFIHIGRISTKIVKPCFPNLLSRSTIAIGNATIRHTSVLTSASSRDSPSACMWLALNMAVTLSKVIPPPLDVNP